MEILVALVVLILGAILFLFGRKPTREDLERELEANRYELGRVQAGYSKGRLSLNEAIALKHREDEIINRNAQIQSELVKISWKEKR